MRPLLLLCALVGLTLAACPRADAATATGPLRVLAGNPRYFTDGSGRAVFLTGMHTWGNLQDRGDTWPPPVFDYNGYLDRLQAQHHNLIRLWAWENPRWAPWTAGDYYVDPMPFARTGPGNAIDGRPKFDCTQFNQAYFDRLRARVMAARDRGIYVSVMLFEGWSIESKQGSGNPWPSHPFNGNNNINGINGDTNFDNQGTECYDVANAAVNAAQKAYVRKVVDSINDLDNVLYEIANEGGGYSANWQYDMIRYVKSYESGKARQHPVGMTYPWPAGDNSVLFNSPADWIAPGNDDAYKVNPPAGTGAKVVMADTDHIWGMGGDDVWAWKSFTRGLNTLFMDDLADLGPTDYRTKARRAMGQTNDYAQRMNLAAMTPRGDLASTGYCLANPGAEYLVLQPSGGAFSVDLGGTSSAFAVEWFDPGTGTATGGGTITGGGSANLTPPFGGMAVLYLKSTGSTALPDVVVTSLSYANGIFTCSVKNQGAVATPSNVVIGVGYLVDGSPVTWGSVNGPLAAGASVTVGTGGGASVIASGTHTITAYVDDVNRFAESDETNNKLSQTISIGTGSSSPFGGTPRAIPGTIQAEDFDDGGEGVAYHDSDSANAGGGYRATGVDIRACSDTGGGWQVGWIAPGEWLQYSVNATGGTYDVTLRVASGASGGSAHLSLDGAAIGPAITFGGTGSYDTWRDITVGGVPFAGGAHVLRLSMDSGSFDVNSLRIAASGGGQSTPFGGTARAIPGTIQAEDFDDGGEGVAYHDVDASNIGGAYRSTGVDVYADGSAANGNAVGWIAVGEWLRYTVNVGTTGNYDLSARVALPGGGGAFHVEVDGGNASGTLTVPDTGGWTSYAVITRAGVGLTAGQHVLRLVFDGAGASGVCNLDSLAFAPSGGGSLSTVAIDLAGPAVTVDGQAMLSFTQALANGLSVSNGQTWNGTYTAALSPAPDADTLNLLQSEYYRAQPPVGQGFSLAQTIANGTYDVWVWTIENWASNARDMDLKLEGNQVATAIGDQPLNHWTKYGPYRVTVSDGVLNIDVLKHSKGDPALAGIVIVPAAPTAIAALEGERVADDALAAIAEPRRTLR